LNRENPASFSTCNQKIEYVSDIIEFATDPGIPSRQQEGKTPVIQYYNQW
jgi:hypothetical protein